MSYQTWSWSKLFAKLSADDTSRQRNKSGFIEKKEAIESSKVISHENVPVHLKETKSATVNIFRNFLFSF